MRADQKTIGKLLQGQTQFLVPVFQRRYVWEKDSVRRLWGDLATLSTDGMGRHFLGTVVLAPTPFATGFDKWLVVDGQQRLTTLGILFCALRDHVRPTDPGFAKKIDELYLLNPHEEGEDRLKLVPIAQEDRAAWFALVKGAPNAGGENKIGEAYRVFRQELVRQDDDEPIDVTRIERAIAYQCDVVEVSVDKNDNLYRIFESLNYGGEPLLQADLLRNYVFMRLPTRWRAVHDQHWEPMEALLKPEQIEELVRINLVLLGHDRVARDAVYQTQQSQMQNLVDEADVEAWVVELHRQARVFKRIVAPGEEQDPLVGVALERLGRWETTAANPIALAILSQYDQGALTPAETIDALRVIESYAARRYLVGIPSSSNSRILAALLQSLDGAVPTAATLARHLSRPQWEFPADDQVREAVIETNFYNRKPATRKYILRCVEDDYRHRERINLDVADLTVEHILPQNLSDEWRAMLARDATDEESVDDIHSSLVHTLGNLTLTAYNEELGNDGFAAKRKILANSGLAMNRDVASHPSWGKREILARGAALADRIVRIWPGPMAVHEAALKSDPPAGSTPKPAPGSRTMPSPGPGPARHRSSPPAPPSAVPPPPADAPPAATPAIVAARTRRTSATDRKWRRLPQILAVIPAGRWTSFADIAEVIGGHPATVGQLIVDGSFANAHRVLKLRSPVAAGQQRHLLEAEGVRFDRHGKAASDQRIKAEDLSVAIGLDVSA
jgi:alkylated DNA nucleotide flippase Atl1